MSDEPNSDDLLERIRVQLECGPGESIAEAIERWKALVQELRAKVDELEFDVEDAYRSADPDDI